MTLHLTSKNFELVGRELRVNIPRFAFVLFYTPTCVYCDTIKPVFERCARATFGCAFRYMNLDKEIVSMSHESNTQIHYVPYMLLYFNGTAIAQFVAEEQANNEQNYEAMSRFLSHHIQNSVGGGGGDQTTTTTTAHQSAANMYAQRAQTGAADAGWGRGGGGTAQRARGGTGGSGGGRVPSYSIGIPGNYAKSASGSSSILKNVCYLSYDAAYGSDTASVR